ncbi:hypothetical protein [Desulfonema limicola]|uniref:hypothetical protein n=1 Tax=Desulfonema limicola TaxID=45656 RepID=UPI001A9BD788|nr:hypothetical protein [Desulfonema limicola]
MQDKLLIWITGIIIALYPLYASAGPKESGCCLTDTAPAGHICPSAQPCDPSGNGYCISCWDQAVNKSDMILTPMQTDPGGWLFGPSQGVTPFSTYDGNTQFNASAYGENQTLYLVGGLAVCFLGTSPSGINISVKKAIAPDFNTFDSGVSYQVSGVGKKGFAMCPSWATDWDTPPDGECQYFAWNFHADSKTLSADSTLANRIANASDLPLHQAMENFTCVNPSICQVTEHTIYLNAQYILSQLASGIMDSIISNAPQYQVTTFSSSTLPAECMAFSLVSVQNEGGASPVVKCWSGEGEFVNCKSIAGLTERSEAMSIVTKSESYAVSTSERGAFFIDDPVSGVQIRSPYGIVSEQGQARVEFGTSNSCRVGNFHSFGSRETGWVNRISGTNAFCEQGNWDCIFDNVRKICANYESNPDCRLVEEFIDGIPSVQFGNSTNLIGDRMGTCWTGQYYTVTPDSPELIPPPGYEDLAREESPTMPGIYLTCGDFQVIERRYICSGDRLVDSDSAKNAAIHSSNLTAANNSKNMSFVIDQDTGDMLSYTYDGITRIPEDSSGNPINLGAGSNPDCPVDEMVCVVTWQADSLIYGDGRTRENISNADPFGAEQTAPALSLVEKQVRSCVTGSTGMPQCPYDAASETIQQDCACISMMGEAIANLSLLRTVSNDIKCGDSENGSLGYTDKYMRELDAMRPKKCPGEEQEIKYDYFCSVVNQTVSTGYSTKCADQFHKREILDSLSLQNGLAGAFPFTPFEAVLSTDDLYQCKMSLGTDAGISITPGGIEPKSNWFDICYNQFIPDAQTYVTSHVHANFDNPPDDLCTPVLSSGSYTGSRADGGCGFDNWTVTAGPERINDIGLMPTSYKPFGHVSMEFSITREFDNIVSNSLDCNNDGWADCFSCTYRSAGYDCDKNCIADNDISSCDHITGIDCNSDMAAEYPSCTVRDAGRDCSGDFIADDDYTQCTRITGFDCNGDSLVDYASCSWRDSGYDYNGDCIADSSSSSATDAVLCGTHNCNPHNPHECSECCDNPHDCNCTGSGADMVCETCYTCYDYDQCPNTCSGTYVSSGYDCEGTGCADSGCVYLDGYDCSGDGIIDNNVNDCTYVSAGYDCYNDNRAESECVYIDGYDCGTNSGAISNQNPDKKIDNNMNFCAHVAAGYDCDNNCNAIHPAWTDGGSNSGIDSGTCETVSALADPECKMGAHKCSRIDEPGKCGTETSTISLNVSIMNGAGRTPAIPNEYYCTIQDKDFEINSLEYENEARFLTEGCQSVFNEVYFDDNGMYQYIRYEDWIELAAKATCQWRNPHTMLSCTQDPFRDTNGEYIHVENLSNPEMAVE